MIIAPTQICPNLQPHWHLEQSGDRWELVSPDRRLPLTPETAYILQYFDGSLSVAQIQAQCEEHLGTTISPTLVIDTIQDLIDRGIFSLDRPEEIPAQLPLPLIPQQPHSPLLKPTVQWFYHPDSYWILRNSADVTRQLRISHRYQPAIDRLGLLPEKQLLGQYHLTPKELTTIWQNLTTAGMVEGYDLQPQKFRLGFWQLAMGRFPLFNPDPWLSRTVPYLHWLWTAPFGYLLLIFLLISLLYGGQQQASFIYTWKILWGQHSPETLIQFGILSLLVISLHELGHAYTLKHFDRTVPHIGIMLMLFLPAAFTDTTDQYTLTRSQRALVVGAGVITQLAIAALGFWLWQFSSPGTWFHTTSFLLVLAALFTVTINLNPLSRFDGYYLLVALSGTNNLKSLSRRFYQYLLQGHRPQTDRWFILAIYAPLGLLYTFMVLGILLHNILDWTLVKIPMLTLLAFIAWLGWFFLLPEKSANI